MSCIFCNKTMGRATKRQWILNQETGEIKGQAHKTCAGLKILHSHRYSMIPTLRFPDHPQGPKLDFGLRMARLYTEIQTGSPKIKLDIYKMILISEGIYSVSSVDELLSLSRVKYLTNWWVNGSHVLSQQELDKLIQSMRDHLEELSLYQSEEGVDILDKKVKVAKR